MVEVQSDLFLFAVITIVMVAFLVIGMGAFVLMELIKHMQGEAVRLTVLAKEAFGHIN